MRAKDKERLAFGVLWLVAAAAFFVTRDGRIGGPLNSCAPMVFGLATGWLLKTFMPEREPQGALSYGVTLAVSLIAMVALIGLVGFVGGLLSEPTQG